MEIGETRLERPCEGLVRKGMSMGKEITFLCIANYFKGEAFV